VACASGDNCERSEAISKEVRRLWKRDRHVASLLAMTLRSHFHSNDTKGDFSFIVICSASDNCDQSAMSAVEI